MVSVCYSAVSSCCSRSHLRNQVSVRILRNRRGDVTNSARRIQFLQKLINAKSYLEVGVYEGDTFLQLDFEEMVAVDPLFCFDIVANSAPGREFYSMSSDSFFGAAISNRQFDIIFLDGLHTYDQTLRDLINALLCAHPCSFILLDDTVPNDVYSAMRDPSIAFEMRRGAYSGPPDAMNLCWHGDTYKILFYVKLFLSKMEYATINTDGNPQTLLWNRSLFPDYSQRKPPFIPFVDLRALRHVVESMRHVDYVWTLNEFRDIFQECGEDQILDYFSTAMLRPA